MAMGTSFRAPPFFTPPPLRTPPSHPFFASSRTCLVTFALRSSLHESEVFGEDVMRMFAKERQLNGDFVSKVSDMLWWKEMLKFEASETINVEGDKEQNDSVNVVDDEKLGGFLKLTRTKEWVSGDNIAPVNRKMAAKDFKNDSERQKKLNLLRYEALKRELLLLTAAIGTACSVYCFIQFSFEAALSYGVGVLFSCLYLQLLYYHSDNMTRDDVPEIFKQKKLKKIGIRSEDLKNTLEKTLNGCTMALSSPRLVIPAAIYGLWALSHNFVNDYFDFELVPAMFGFFAYKAAALVQVYRDNEDLVMVFPDKEDESINT
ncbi:uncharacterized protein LOC120265718 isoform X1 [Dioscorea cayenensis subsp. rotundata]|uniref:Uncharacterized protein LOC120265718 isoform X1 n=1 Tax=Dioscorea cayennensis subsp. rotundata TaxID=55577 RepID=A0AB40BQB9_DIOCR|nr:uncharacterized protein LOC120265718 isoform X1 [Dioscorea cayenensis subsp. rotundata]